ncbi:spondin domain-containing protein [Ningiella sp. W23]|uniref:spondin domain-containing protein n=1 Tax=Ningiella sp. W23 TaxID=3023715 RepID=UPI003757DCEF
MKTTNSRLASRIKLGSLVVAALFAFSSIANATVLRVTVENNASPGGLSFTPVFAAFHSADYDAFDVGGTASDGLEAIAELGMIGGLQSELASADPNAVSSPIFPDAGMRPLFAGESGSATFEIDDPASNMFFTFLSMILPSNDTFFGRDDAAQIFDTSGNYLGNQVFQITGADLYDAGTEALDIMTAPFIPGNDAGASPEDSNTSIRPAEALDAFAGLTLANGSVLDASLIDFLSNPSAFNVATITIERVNAPSAFAMMLLLAGGFIFRAKLFQHKAL